MKRGISVTLCHLNEGIAIHTDDLKHDALKLTRSSRAKSTDALSPPRVSTALDTNGGG